MQPEQQLISLGISLPEVPQPIASYIPAIEHCKMVLTSGQLPIEKGVVIAKGKVGKDVTVEDAKKAARLACLNALAAIRNEITSLNHIDRILALTVVVQSADGFSEQSQVANGASDLLQDIFGDKGKHTRMAIGVNQLPLNACVELSLTAATI